MNGFNDTLVVRRLSCPEDCQACIDACIKQRGLPAIKPVHLPEVGFYSLIVCNQCSEPSCAEVCPTGAITKNKTSGIINIDSEKCVGCGLCTLACPYGGIY